MPILPPKEFNSWLTFSFAEKMITELEIDEELNEMNNHVDFVEYNPSTNKISIGNPMNSEKSLTVNFSKDVITEQVPSRVITMDDDDKTKTVIDLLNRRVFTTSQKIAILIEEGNIKKIQTFKVKIVPKDTDWKNIVSTIFRCIFQQID